jgi:TetR/AcrR family transcriptional regulator
MSSHSATSHTLEEPTPPGAADATQRILATAERLFAELGFDAVSMSMIAEQAGVSKGNIFHHFASKDALYLTVLKSACAESTRLMDDLGSINGSLADRLVHFTEAHLAHLKKHHHIATLIQREMFEDGPRRGKALAERVCSEHFTRLVDILRDGRARGELRKDCDLAIIAHLLVSADIFFMQASDILRHSPDLDFAEDPARYSRKVVEVILTGVQESIT